MQIHCTPDLRYLFKITAALYLPEGKIPAPYFAARQNHHVLIYLTASSPRYFVLSHLDPLARKARSGSALAILLIFLNFFIN